MPRHRHNTVYTVLIIIVLMFVYLNRKFSFDKIDKIVKEPVIKYTNSTRDRDNKLILLWTNYSHLLNWQNSELIKPDFFEKMKCPETRCRILFSNQKDTYPITEYDAIVFNGYDILKKDAMPRKRSKHQTYVFFSREPPYPWWLEAVNFNVIYNLTITYRTDADIFIPYFYILEKNTNLVVAPSLQVKWKPFENDFTDSTLLEMAKAKTKNIVSVMSHCSAISGRDILIKELRKHIDISMYGKCGTEKCDLPHFFCSEDIPKNYKFYAAFENSLCKNYVSEKIYIALSTNIIPLVFGASNYSFYAPPHSFIDVGDYENYEELAKYLKFLSDNPDEYIKYFWWKKYYKIDSFSLKFCALCEHLHWPHLKNQIKYYGDMKKYWYDGACVHTITGSNPQNSNLLAGSKTNLTSNIKRLVLSAYTKL